MPKVEGLQKLFSVSVRNRFGVPCRFGKSMFAEANFGAEETYIAETPFGVASFADSIFGNIFMFSGIYHKIITNKGNEIRRHDYYFPKNPRKIPQQANRAKLGPGIVAWRNLTQEQKGVYNKRALRKEMSGYNLFLREYLLSH
jgi:hypothetical protein